MSLEARGFSLMHDKKHRHHPPNSYIKYHPKHAIPSNHSEPPTPSSRAP
jgi:hypothetical protein